MEWTKEQRYRSLEDASEKEMAVLTETVNNCSWRQKYHIQPNTGLLNDPNGFAFFNGEYHLFYQWFPLGPVHGLKYWYHVKSTDLVHWEDAGIGIKPDTPYESHGAFSGSGIVHHDKLYLFYTGNTRDEEWVRHPYQCIAVMDKDGSIKKAEKPVISEVPNGYTDHFRDPKVWKENDMFYAVIGIQRSDQTGAIVLYRSPDLLDWSFLGELKTNLPDFGYMWECPDYFSLQGQGVLIFSPQGLAAEGDNYQNIYQSGYCLGDPLDLQTKELKHNGFIELDRGFDFYAPQTTLDEKERRLLVGWMGLPDIDYPTDANGWAHCLTLPRVLSVKNNKLIQQPAEELHLLRKSECSANDIVQNEEKSYPGFKGTTYELMAEFQSVDADKFGIKFRAGVTEETIIMYNRKEKKVILDRTASGKEVAKDYGTTRKCNLEAEAIKFHLFVDVSSVEIFINDGEEVFTSRIFPKETSEDILFFAEEGSVALKATIWQV
ncbi:glycoside hydrolase family 32 protein [Niallia sp. 01092]|uniref:glycoside hydrolase family 32 protein n=1 Tax=unclassified Niallia TaxID=2837522 RepID=UPI003FD41DB4